MQTKLVAFIIMCCCYLCLQAHSRLPLKEIEMPPRKLLQQAAATGPADYGTTETRPGDSLASRLVMIAVASLCAMVLGILCRLRGRNTDTQNAEPAAAETPRPNVTYNFIGSCFSLN